MMSTKKLFMISVIGKEGSMNRRYAETMLWLLNTHSDFSKEYRVELHIHINQMDLYKSLDEAIQEESYEGYVVLLDSLETDNGLFNPNVMFEFGGIKNLGKPFVVMAACNDANQFPFDIKNLNIGFIPKLIVEYIANANEGNEEDDVRLWFNKLSDKDKTIILDFFTEQYSKYRVLLSEKENEEKLKDEMYSLMKGLIRSHRELKTEILKITNFVSNTAEYIDGEAAAFSALSEAVQKAKYSLRTSRFANQSIVKEPTREQAAFMSALYKASQELGENAVRIICNNNPVKWQDIYNILFNGGNKSRVYVRKADFSIHFEMVVIDESVAFIHFYQQVHPNSSRRGDSQQIEKLNSTLKIQGSSICQKFAGIYDRLHHEDIERGTMHDLSRTLLGVDFDDYNGSEKDTQERVGYFVLDCDRAVNIATKHQMIMKMFKDAFQNWKLGPRDKINMASGISLLENDDGFVNEMRDKGFLNDDDYNSAMKLFQENCENEAV